MHGHRSPAGLKSAGFRYEAQPAWTQDTGLSKETGRAVVSPKRNVVLVVCRSSGSRRSLQACLQVSNRSQWSVGWSVHMCLEQDEARVDCQATEMDRIRFHAACGPRQIVSRKPGPPDTEDCAKCVRPARDIQYAESGWLDCKAWRACCLTAFEAPAGARLTQHPQLVELVRLVLLANPCTAG